MSKEQAKILLEKYREGRCEPAELAKIEAWYSQWNMGEPSLSEGDTIHAAARVANRLKLSRPKRLNFLRPLTAAAILVVIGVAVLLYQINSNSARSRFKNDISPGGNYATLTLGDGSKIALSAAPEGTLAQQNGVSIEKAADGYLVYKIRNNKDQDLLYNTIQTPRGGLYQIELQDGSHVWLNAASSLRFPTRFSANQRRVSLSGEGYFEVAKDRSRPFIVESRGQQVEVLGTHFNINSYSEDGPVQTTLLEGAVRIIPEKGIPGLLHPGEQAYLEATGLKISSANTETAVAWKNGQFTFERQSLSTIMAQLSRWYNIEVSYRDVDTQQKFSGSISRFGNISQVLEILELTHTVKFKIEGRRVTVMR